MTYIARAGALGPSGPTAQPSSCAGQGPLVAWSRVVTEAPRIQKKSPTRNAGEAVLFRSLTMTYSRMGRSHTTIGAGPFHF